MRTDTIIIGGGQAGLAMGYYLARRGREFTILDAGERVGDAWRGRWDSLTLFTPARYSALPGMPFPGAPEAYPGKDQVADYLEAYADAFTLPIRLRERVSSVEPTGVGYRVETGRASYETAHVVVATGPFQEPWVPDLAQGLSPHVAQFHSTAYQSPEQLPAGDVLVVGGGNSGVQIAEELALSRRVALAVGARMPRLPQRLLGRSIFWWLERSGLLDVSVGSRLGRRMSRAETLIGKSPGMLRRVGIDVVGRALEARGDVVLTLGGARHRVAAVVWATGFRPDYHWLRVPVLDGSGRPVHHRGVTGAPGLFFLGLPWLHTRGSALIGWVGRDAEYLAGLSSAGGNRSAAASEGSGMSDPQKLQHYASRTHARGLP